MTPVDAIEEVVADACEEMLLSSRLAMEMAYEKPELERTIVDWLKRFAAKIKAAVSPDARRHTEAVIMREFADELQTMWDRALTRATLRPDGADPSTASGSPPLAGEAGNVRETGGTPSVAEATPPSEREAGGTPSDVAAHETRSETEDREDVRETGTKASVREIGNTGIYYVQADRQVLTGNDADAWGEQLTNYINRKIRKGEDVILNTADGEMLKLTKTTAEKGAFRNTWVDKNGIVHLLTDEEYQTKLNAEAHIDELVQVSKDANPNRANKVDFNNLHGDLAFNGWRYRNAFFMDLNNRYYSLNISVADGKNGKVVYNVAGIKERSFPQIIGSSDTNTGAQSRKASLTERVSQPSEIVKQKNALEKAMPEIKASERDSEGRELSAGQAEYFAKNTDNLNPTEDADIRFSNRDRTEGDTEEERRGREESYAALRKENERLKQQAEYWKGQTKTTKEKTVREKDIERFAQTLLKEYGSDAEKAGVVSKLRELGSYLMVHNH